MCEVLETVQIKRDKPTEEFFNYLDHSEIVAKRIEFLEDELNEKKKEIAFMQSKIFRILKKDFNITEKNVKGCDNIRLNRDDVGKDHINIEYC